jgi:hypothetical protein
MAVDHHQTSLARAARPIAILVIPELTPWLHASSLLHDH